jgi:RNA polymerase sigma-70 factor (ECF subfamily)
MIKSLNIHPNQELINASRRNDRKAQMMLYNNYSKAMYHTANRILENAAEAEDVMQDAFIEAFQKISQLSDEASFGAWLKRIVINRALDVVKREKVSQSYQEMMKQELSEVEEAEEEDSDAHYKLFEVREAMKNLPKQYRIVLSLHLFEGMDHEEMAQILNLEYNNVKTKYSRARHRLLEEVKKLQNQHINKEVWNVEN